MVHAGRFAEQAGYPFIEPLRKATDKLRSRLNEEQAEQLERHTAAFEVIQPENRRTPGDILRELELAVAESRTLYIHYEKWKGSEPERRKVNPYGLAHRLYKWYLIGHCHLRADMRVFRADRIAAVEQTEETFVRPESFSLRDFLQNRFVKEQHDADKGAGAHQEPGVTVRLQGSPYTISILCDHWYFHDKVATHTQTEVTLMLDEAAVGDFLPRHLLSYGTNIRVLEPAALRRRMAEVALELAAFHAGDGEASAKQQEGDGSPICRID
jgi:predicted DNA-binding transcriptional regulator YafY